MAHIPAKLDSLYREVCKAYESLPIVSDDEIDTCRAYTALCSELTAQLDLLRGFVQVEFTELDPYASSVDMFNDILTERHLQVYTGGEPIDTRHMFSRVALLNFGGQAITYNHVFRAVHDGLAHYPERNSFGPVGEHRAFLAHARILSPLAVQALATETLGQNAYYYVHKTYAPQKFGLLPAELVSRALQVKP